jgi:hypothetical protein
VPLRLRHPIARQEPSTAYELLRDEPIEGVLLAGAAGIGKSDIVLDVIEQARADNWPVLCLRVDRLTAGPSVDSLGEQLELGGSPASVLDAVAEGGPSLLVIDQLDALSLASGRLRELWEPVYTLIRQAQALQGMRVLLACRQFDLDGDFRLRSLTSNRISTQSARSPSSHLASRTWTAPLRQWGSHRAHYPRASASFSESRFI